MCVTVSKMSGKLLGLQGINTNPLTNPFCQRMAKKPGCICARCYSVQMLRTSRRSCAPAWERNGALLSKPLEQIPVVTAALCRFSAHGELLNRQHYENYCIIARAHPRTTFALFTKRKDLVEPDLAPPNLVLVYSNPVVDKIMDKPPPGFHKVFNVIDKLDIPTNCSAESCFKCGKCYYRNAGPRCIIERIK